MKIVDDELTYLDENNKSLGYEVTSGKQRKKSSVVDFISTFYLEYFLQHSSMTHLSIKRRYNNVYI